MFIEYLHPLFISFFFVKENDSLFILKVLLLFNLFCFIYSCLKYLSQMRCLIKTLFDKSITFYLLQEYCYVLRHIAHF